MIKQMFELVPASEPPKEEGYYRTIGDVMRSYFHMDKGVWADNITHWLRPSKGLFVQEEKVEEYIKEIFDAGYDYRSSLLPQIIEQFDEKSAPDFAEFYNLMKEK